MTKKLSEEKILERITKPKICRKCKQLTEYENLSKRKAYKGTNIQSTYTICKRCFNKANDERKRKNNPDKYLEDKVKRGKNNIINNREKHKNRKLLKLYKIDLNWYYDNLIIQEFKCLICSTEISERSARVDHCHSTNKVRGLLCNLCNVGLGSFKDNITSLENAIKYLQY